MSSLNDVVISVAGTIRQVKGIKQAPNYPPETAGVYPFVAVWAGAGDWMYGTAWQVKKGLHSVRIELHIARKNQLSAGIKKAMEFADSIPNDLMRDPTLGGTCSIYSNIRTDGVIPMIWNGVDTIGIRWVIEGIKIESTIE